jgi:hypothetical protein
VSDQGLESLVGGLSTDLSTFSVDNRAAAVRQATWEFLQKNFVAGRAISLKCAVASPGAGIGQSRHRYNYDFERRPAGERATARQAALTMRHANH